MHSLESKWKNLPSWAKWTVGFFFCPIALVTSPLIIMAAIGGAGIETILDMSLIKGKEKDNAQHNQ